MYMYCIYNVLYVHMYMYYMYMYCIYMYCTYMYCMYMYFELSVARICVLKVNVRLCTCSNSGMEGKSITFIGVLDRSIAYAYCFPGSSAQVKQNVVCVYVCVDSPLYDTGTVPFNLARLSL